jgi:hypothetical protein
VGHSVVYNLSDRAGGNIYIEKYFALVTKDIESATDALEQPLPDSIRTGLIDELRKLAALNAVLTGESAKSVVHSLRAKLRYARIRLKAAKGVNDRKEIEGEISELERAIRQEAARK